MFISFSDLSVSQIHFELAGISKNQSSNFPVFTVVLALFMFSLQIFQPTYLHNGITPLRIAYSLVYP